MYQVPCVFIEVFQIKSEYVVFSICSLMSQIQVKKFLELAIETKHYYAENVLLQWYQNKIKTTEIVSISNIESGRKVSLGILH